MRLRPARTPSQVPDAVGDEAQVRAAYDAHGGELYRFAVRSTGDVGAAQDIVQETFLRAWRSAQRYDPAVASLRVWLFAITRNVIVDHHRAVGARPWLRELTGEPEVGIGSVPDPADRLLGEQVVGAALARLGPEHRQALTETYLRDRPYAEVAAQLDIPVGTLRSRVFYGLKALRVVLDEMEVTP